ncbi:MAG: 30S ribosomal protein S17 [Candidatus Omnitrophica bacterium]|nr:30S ribosomal protein S17 [Candidatus Omnitrophota bacterium]MBU4589396.1 30S ribosomal protein S17 [Candidatus Omnitrophota bacterium]
MQPRAKRKQRTGVVISDKMNKTIVVRLDRTAKHPVYRRIVKQVSKFMVHDEGEKAKIGDKVKIQETRPMSKNKRWRLVEVLK